MKNLILALFIVFSVQSLFAQATPKKAWRPESFSKLSPFEQKIISNLTPVNQKNKGFVQLLLDIGGFEACGMGTALRHDKIFVSVVVNKVQKRYSYVLDFNKALVNESSFKDQGGNELHVLVFDQAIKSPAGDVVDETIMMYFNFDSKGAFRGIKINSKKNSGFYPLISSLTARVENSYEVICLAK